ncbi:DUF3592 domain-containing protein [Carboxylicivirga sp. A043]|uniref:DUF3592 domain-containing protein n=1 Tax=Carboxylicivirga litoralis TaxID=2816963 RepID=UPI0021CB8B00|nr:DUF3592 domain-containing protein [Carboxylicivirga sp. A043]MCU4155602.1 DUF3592 domain-containing protein [Carboxylicivirga sp. A043]
MKRQSSILSTFMFAIIFGVAGWFAYQHVTKPIVEDAEASEQWPVVSGEITYANIKTSRSSEGNTMYSPDIRYTYTVSGKDYTGKQISLMDGSTSVQSSVKKKVKAYPVGASVEVYYDPELPASSVLQPGKSFWINLLLYAPLSFCVIAGLMVLNSIKRVFRLILT